MLLLLLSIYFILLCIVVNCLPVCPCFLDSEIFESRVHAFLVSLFFCNGACYKQLHVVVHTEGLLIEGHDITLSSPCFVTQTEEVSERLIVVTGGDKVI